MSKNNPSHFGQIVEISNSGRHLSLTRGFLEISLKGESLAKIPLDDILALIVSGFGCTHSSNVLVALSDRGIPVAICGSNFVPRALVLPLEGNVRQSLRIRHQAKMSEPLKKNLWKQVVKGKLKNQALVLKAYKLPFEGLLGLSRRVKSGDPDNFEAQGARRYWSLLFGDTFRRDPDAEGKNAMLNYAYAIIRSCVARGVVASGLHPSLGIHHKNTYNPMCLVDDLMEPFRPIADYVVKQLSDRGYEEVSREVKEYLAFMVVVRGDYEGSGGSLFQECARVARALAMFISGEKTGSWGINFRFNSVCFSLENLRDEKEKYSA